jgi:molybdopterin converting factor small subunit
MMKINVRFAGYFRTLAEKSSLELELERGATVEDALAQLNEIAKGRFQQVFYAGESGSIYPNCLFLIDTQVVDRDAILQDESVLAIVPPMAGGQL